VIEPCKARDDSGVVPIARYFSELNFAEILWQKIGFGAFFAYILFDKRKDEFFNMLTNI